MKHITTISVLAAVLIAAMAVGTAATTVPGHQDRDGVVTGHYTAVYAYDAAGDWYFDLGDGRVQGTVDSVDDLDQSTLTTCDYVVNYRGSFGGDPFLDNGWIQNHINCQGYDDNGTYQSMYVHESDPRYSDDLESIWNTWGVFVDTADHLGNLARGPTHHVNE